MDRTKEYSFVLSTMPRLHARSKLLELGVWQLLTANLKNTSGPGDEVGKSITKGYRYDRMFKY